MKVTLCFLEKSLFYEAWSAKIFLKCLHKNIWIWLILQVKCMARSARNFWRFGDPHPKSQLLVAKSQNPKLINGKSQSQIPKLNTRNPKNPKLITRNPKNPNLKLLNPTSQDKAMPPSERKRKHMDMTTCSHSHKSPDMIDFCNSSIYSKILRWIWIWCLFFPKIIGKCSNWTFYDSTSFW